MERKEKKNKLKLKTNIHQKNKNDQNKATPYHYTDYKEFITDYCHQYNFTVQFLANSTQIQKSYLSKVLKHQVHLNEEQFFKIIRFLKIEDRFHDYLFLLLRFARATNVDYKNILQKKVNELQRDKLSLTNRLSTQNIISTSDENHSNLIYYFLNPLIQVVHSCLSIDKFRKDCEKLETVLDISAHDLIFCLKILKELKHIDFTRRSDHKIEIELLTSFLHLDKEHPLAKQNHVNWRINALKKLQEDRVFFKRENKSDFTFTATICGSKELFNSLNEDLKNLIISYNNKLKNSNTEIVSQLNIDSFTVVDSD
ncbi:MAG: hypothetical protein HQK49_09525 [Oligoflexia bacterium]|nr:hypothetical protein [Oligoflexia bacterium]